MVQMFAGTAEWWGRRLLPVGSALAIAVDIGGVSKQ